MKNHLIIITLMALAIFISGCSPFSAEPAHTPTPIDTPIQAVLIATFPPTLPSTDVPTEIPTLEPNSTASPMDSLTATMEETLTPVATGNSYTSALITNVSLSVTKGSTPCASGTPVTFTSSITSNNQTKLQYKWLLSGAGSNAGQIRTTDMLSTAGTITLTVTYKLKCGSYSIGFQVVYPNFVTAKKKFTLP